LGLTISKIIFFSAYVADLLEAVDKIKARLGCEVRVTQGGYSIVESVLYAQYIVATCPRHGQILRLQRH
jgi:hypothetical protein